MNKTAVLKLHAGWDMKYAQHCVINLNNTWLLNSSKSIYKLVLIYWKSHIILLGLQTWIDKMKTNIKGSIKIYELEMCILIALKKETENNILSFVFSVK